jgi:hypothetical protein
MLCGRKSKKSNQVGLDNIIDTYSLVPTKVWKFFSVWKVKEQCYILHFYPTMLMWQSQLPFELVIIKEKNKKQMIG